MKDILAKIESRWHSHGVKFIRTPKKFEWIKTLRSVRCAICKHQDIENRIDQSFPMWGILANVTNHLGKYPEICPDHMREMTRNVMPVPRFAQCQCGVRQREKIFGLGWPGWAQLQPTLPSSPPQRDIEIVRGLMCPNCTVSLAQKLGPNFTRETWTALVYVPGQLLTAVIMNQNQDNFEALIQGHAGAPTTTAKARVYTSADQTIASGGGNKTIQFDSESYDPGANFNVANYRFTAPVTGYYQINMTLQWEANAQVNYRMTMYVDYDDSGVFKTVCSVQRDHNDIVTEHISDIIYMVATHFIQMECWQNSGANCDIDNGEDVTFFSIHFLSI